MAFKLETLTFKDLGGVRTDKSLANFELHEAVVARNVRVNKIGQVRRRKGDDKYNDTVLPDGSDVQGLHHFKYGTSSQKFLVAENGILYTDTGASRTEIKTGMDTGSFWSFATYNSYTWISDGTNTFQKYNGTTVTNASIAAPAVGTFATAVNAAAGNLNGSYQWLVSFYNSTTGQESQPFPLEDSPAAINPANERADLTGIPISTDTQVNARRVYRTTAGGAITRAALVHTIANNVDVNWTDNVADVDLGMLIDLGYDAAPEFVKVVGHNDRLFGFTSNSSILRYSRWFNGWYFPIGNEGADPRPDARDYREYAGKGDGDKLTNVIKYFEYLIIFKENSVYVLDGYERANFRLRKLEFEERVGCVGHRAAVVAGNWCYFIDKSGIYRTNAQRIEKVGKAVEAFFDAANPNVTEKVDFVYLKNAIAIAQKTSSETLVKFSFAALSTGNKNGLHLIYNYMLDRWVWDTGYNAQSWAVKEIGDQDILIRGDNNGWLWNNETQEGDGGLINGTAIASSNTTLEDDTQDWTVNKYAGVYIEILEGTGVGQRRLISSNTATIVTVTEAWEENPDTTSVYTIGGIDGYYLHGFNDYLTPAHNKNLKYLNLWIESTGNYSISTFVCFNLQQEIVSEMMVTLSINAAWDTDSWDEFFWDDAGTDVDVKRSPTSQLHRWSAAGIKHKKAGQPFICKGYIKLFNVKGIDTTE